MRILLAFFVPWFVFFTIGRPFAGLLCLTLQLTVLGWIPAFIWACYALSHYTLDKKLSAWERKVLSLFPPTKTSDA